MCTKFELETPFLHRVRARSPELPRLTLLGPDIHLTRVLRHTFHGSVLSFRITPTTAKSNNFSCARMTRGFKSSYLASAMQNEAGDVVDVYIPRKW